MISCRYCSSFRGPSRVGFEHRVDGDEQFSHARDDSDFLGFSCGHKFLIKSEDDRIVPGRDQRCHIQHRPKQLGTDHQYFLKLKHPRASRAESARNTAPVLELAWRFNGLWSIFFAGLVNPTWNSHSPSPDPFLDSRLPPPNPSIHTDTTEMPPPEWFQVSVVFSSAKPMHTLRHGYAFSLRCINRYQCIIRKSARALKAKPRMLCLHSACEFHAR